MRRFVYVLQHLYYYGSNNEYEEIKMLGVYSTRLKSIRAMRKYLLLPGFKDFTVNCFEIYKYKVDKIEYKKIETVKWRKYNKK